MLLRCHIAIVYIMLSLVHCYVEIDQYDTHELFVYILIAETCLASFTCKLFLWNVKSICQQGLLLVEYEFLSFHIDSILCLQLVSVIVILEGVVSRNALHVRIEMHLLDQIRISFRNLDENIHIQVSHMRENFSRWQRGHNPIKDRYIK